ncbi:MAG TPA: excinuclease ABC subunit UvrC [Polyangiaceae bacterium]|nr:excinuclease ABC subunit UvrC [Polyangiaceae bacterium]
MLPQIVEDKLAQLPASPGCYLFFDKAGAVLYVGKAKSLRSRVRSYFQEGGSDTRAFIPALPHLLGDLETFVTQTEKEAAILENSLIKEHRPRLNVKLRDDKEYLNLRLDSKVEFPRLELVRRPTSDGARYFGPYHSATSARRTLHLVEKHFKLRTCSDREMKSRSRPCIQYQIQRCPAPCVYEVDRERYKTQVRAVELFLAGRHDQLSRELGERMKQASLNLEFEVAAIYRDQIDAVQKVKEKQRVVLVSDVDQDVLGLYREGDLVELSVVYVRQGRVVEIFTISHTRAEVPDDEVVATFLREHYGEGGLGSAAIPDELLLPVLPEGAEGVSDWLTDRRRSLPDESASRAQVVLLAPQRGPKKSLLELARENAEHAFREKRRTVEDMDQRLRVVQEKLRLPALPRRIECCDISHLGGEATVGSVVALLDGQPDKKRYKAYRVRTTSEGDDYKAMYEVLSRRFRRGIEARKASEGEVDENGEVTGAIDDTWELPDLFVVDGGRGQLGVALTAAEDLGLFDLPICGLAKERETVSGEKMVDRVYLPNQKNPIALRPNTPELFLLARARDEAHRFANVKREAIGTKRRLTSGLQKIHGIGEKTRKALLRQFGSLDNMRDASDDELLAVEGVTRRQVRALREHFAAQAGAAELDGGDGGDGSDGGARVDGGDVDSPDSAEPIVVDSGTAEPEASESDEIERDETEPDTTDGPPTRGD